jgi:thiol:disulfide interchange protein DsbC
MAVFWAVNVQADEKATPAEVTEGEQPASESSEVADDNSALNTLLDSLAPYMQIIDVIEVESPDLFAVVSSNEEVVFLDTSRQMIFTGTVLQVVDGQMVSRSGQIADSMQAAFNAQRKQVMASLDVDTAITFAPEEVKDYIWVFTDVDCPYCQKLHREVPALNAKGIEVRYLGYPRAGLNSTTGLNMQSAWCAEDTLQAMTDLKALRAIDRVTCDNPVGLHFNLGQQVGVTGTPAIVTSGGQLIPGYLPADALAERIGL